MDLPERISFAEQEEKILQLWKELNAFQTQLELSKGKPEVSGDSRFVTAARQTSPAKQGGVISALLMHVAVKQPLIPHPCLVNCTGAACGSGQADPNCHVVTAALRQLVVVAHATCLYASSCCTGRICHSPCHPLSSASSHTSPLFIPLSLFFFSPLLPRSMSSTMALPSAQDCLTMATSWQAPSRTL